MAKFKYQIPYQKDKTRQYRAYEILPGVLSWGILSLPFLLAFTNVRLAAILMLSYLILWFIKAVALNIRVVQGYRTLQEHMRLDWTALIKDLDQKDVEGKKFPQWHYDNKKRQADNPNGIYSKDVVHAVIVATWNEAREVLQPTLENVKNSHYNRKKMIVLLAYEDRGGPAVEKQAKQLMSEYKGVFMVSKAVKHIDQPGEVIGKGGNITAAGPRVAEDNRGEGD